MTKSMVQFRAMLALLLLVAFTGCGPRTPPAAPPLTGFPGAFPAAFYKTIPAETKYRIAPGRSSLLLKVYRTGPLAALGHNHVIEGREVDGFIYLADDLAEARADLFVPVESFVVDDPAARQAAGPDFATQPTSADIEGTRANMLGSKLLDAAAYPYIVMHVTPLNVGPQTTQVTVTVDLHGHTVQMPVDILWRRNDNELTIQAQFHMTHALLGLEPFSALGGALRVADEIDAAVALVAVRSAGTGPGS